jgi:hypothetical protein
MNICKFLCTVLQVNASLCREAEMYPNSLPSDIIVSISSVESTL